MKDENLISQRTIDFRLWTGILRYAFAYRSAMIGLALLAVLMAGLDSALPLVTRWVIDMVSEEGAAADLRRPALAYALLLLAFPVTVRAFIRKAGMLSTHVSHDIRTAAFARLQQLEPAFYDQRSSGWLMARMTSDCDRLAQIVAWGTLDLFWGFTLMLGIAAVMFWLNATLALVALAVVPVLVLVSGRFQKVILQTARRMRKSNSRLTASYNEGITAVRTTKMLAREEASLDEFGVLSREMYGHSMRHAVLSALYLPVVLTLGSIGTGLALWYGAGSVVAGVISLGTLVAFMHYTGQFFDPINEIAALFASMQTAQASAERVLGLIATEPAIVDSQAVQARMTEVRLAGAKPGIAPDGHPDRVGRIDFEGVGFGYDGTQRVLHDFDLSVEPGETIALVGPTGAGKSTIVSLLCRFYEPTEGTIRIDGIDVRDRSLRWLQSQLGIVLQRPHLFSGTVAENIRYGRLQATDAEVEAAARLVQAHDFIESLPDGYRTRVGEGGTGLSIGQKQLVTFARAILKDPAILVLDEATSSVDTETEQRIQAGLQRLLQGRTSFVIAHRLSTIRSADRILFIDGGGIVEQGSHGELMAVDGRYRELYGQQSIRRARPGRPKPVAVTPGVGT